ncbi:hypothetical protein N9N97_02385, partial [Rickettsiaceae bacterium]|nr:hypothetical protein [Rickettsiaceae bacterium]
MKSLKTLIKLNKDKLDKILRKIEYAEIEKTRLYSKKKQVEEEAEQEVRKYSVSQYAYMLDSYMQNTRKLLKRIDLQIIDINTYIGRMREELAYQYADLKKFEIALENKQKIEQEKIKKAEAKYLDEFNTNKFALEQRKLA